MAAFDYTVGHLVISNTPSSTQSVALPFVPKALIYYHAVINLLNIDFVHQIGGFGVTDGINQYANCIWSGFADNPTETRSIWTTSLLYAGFGDTIGGPGNVAIENAAGISAFTPTGYDLAIPAGPFGPSTPATCYIAIGGDDVSTHVGTFELHASGDTTQVSVGFIPDIILFFSAGVSSGAGVVANGKSTMFGSFDGSGAYVNSRYRQDNHSPDDERGNFESNAKAIHVMNYDGTNYADGTVTMTTTGFQVTPTILPAANHTIGYLAIKGCRTKIGEFIQDGPAGGNKAVTGVGFQPSASMYFGDYLTGSGEGASRNSLVFGSQAAAGGAVKASLCWSAHDSASQTYDSTRVTQNHCYIRRDMRGAITIEAFSLNSYDSDGFTIVNNIRGGGPTSQPVNYIMMAEGSNNNYVALNPERCTSAFKYLIGEYGVCGTPDIPKLWQTHNDCEQLSGTASTVQETDVDLGVTYIDDFETADLIAIRGLRNWLEYDNPITVKIRASNDSSFAVYDENSFSVSLNDLTGFANMDWIQELTFPGLKRYWRVRIESTSSLNPALINISLGKSLYLNKAPKFPVEISILDDYTQAAKFPLAFNFSYQGVSHTSKERFDRRLRTVGDGANIWLYDGNDAVLLGRKTAKVVLTRERIRQRLNKRYELDLQFEEVPIAGVVDE